MCINNDLEWKDENNNGRGEEPTCNNEREEKKVVTKKRPSVNTNRSNVVSREVFQEVQINTLSDIALCIANTFGPMGSTTKIISGNDSNSMYTKYSKDGHTVLKHILYSNPIEMSIRLEIEEITRHVETEIGDGTTSAVILADRIYPEIVYHLSRSEYKPYEIIYAFKEVIKDIQNKITELSRDTTIDDIYNICMISTNGNETISQDIADIYEKFGMDVDISVSASTNKDTMIKTYDGLVLESGYSDPAYVNNSKNNTSEIHNANIYAFKDPIDDLNMINLFAKIIDDNIIEKAACSEPYVPTVIIAPKLTRDMGEVLSGIVDFLLSSNPEQRAPIVVITDVMGGDEGVYLDIAKLCGCKMIRKYIDPEIKKRDESLGLAATLDNIHDFAGHAELVISDQVKTKFINPAKMYEDSDKEDEKVPSNDFIAIKNFLEGELRVAKENGNDLVTIDRLKKRLRSINSNMVELLVGGITIADRDEFKDLVVDAVKNCASASKYGVINAANTTGLHASYLLLDTYDELLKTEIINAIFRAYENTVKQLYGTVLDEDDVYNAVREAKYHGEVYDLWKKEYSDKVLTSTMTDIKILEAISKLITVMATSNQCLVQVPHLNTY